MLNAYQRLRAQCLARSTRSFVARGAAVKRCQRCLLGVHACICPWRRQMVINIDIVLLMHRDEVFKPTNSGRLIADVFPGNTYVFEWSRTQPADALLALLADPARYPVVVFPPDDQSDRGVHTRKPHLEEGQKLTLVLLDGTWKQARKMYKTSHWLQAFPLMVLAETRVAQYSVRQAAAAGQLSTAEAVAALLKCCQESVAAQLLSDYFWVFNQHYLATRTNVSPVHSCHHLRLQQQTLPALEPHSIGK